MSSPPLPLEIAALKTGDLSSQALVAFRISPSHAAHMPTYVPCLAYHSQCFIRTKIYAC